MKWVAIETLAVFGALNVVLYAVVLVVAVAADLTGPRPAAMVARTTRSLESPRTTGLD